jgi:hypothetical protein
MAKSKSGMPRAPQREIVNQANDDPVSPDAEDNYTGKGREDHRVVPAPGTTNYRIGSAKSPAASGGSRMPIHSLDPEFKPTGKRSA